MVLPKLVGESQFALFQNRQMIDYALIANKVVWWLKKRKIKVALLKLDFRKAYNTVSWRFLDKVMEQTGFGYIWRGWLTHCVSSMSMSLLINGSPNRPIMMEKGLRKGDPPLPILICFNW